MEFKTAKLLLEVSASTDTYLKLSSEQSGDLLGQITELEVQLDLYGNRATEYRDRLAKLEELCQEFADSPHYRYTTNSADDFDEGCDVCLYCGSLDYEGHSADCPVSKWRALK